MTVILMPSALEDLRAVYAFYAMRSEQSADSVVGTLLKATNGLARFPLLGRQGNVPNTRERLITRYPYRIVYQIVGDTIEVLRIIHTS